MKVFKLCIILVAYLLIGVLEVYSYYLFKNDAIGIFTFNISFGDDRHNEHLRTANAVLRCVLLELRKSD